MSPYTFRPAVREDTPLIIGIAGPTKSGKTYSAHRLAIGLAGGRPVVMINAEGARGHQYADKFKYLACDLKPPFRATAYTEALEEAAKLNPGVIIVDSGSHMHDGPGGTIDWHEEVLDRIAGKDYAKRQRSTFTAWVEPKAAENEFIYALLASRCAVILCFRAKEKLRIVPGKEPVDLGWQPIAGERVAFETLFTLMLPPHSKGVPDLEISDMREPFDTLVPKGKQLDEELGRKLTEWAKGVAKRPERPAVVAGEDPRQELLRLIEEEKGRIDKQPSAEQWKLVCTHICKTEDLATATPEVLEDLLTLTRGLVAKDKGAIATTRRILGVDVGEQQGTLPAA